LETSFNWLMIQSILPEIGLVILGIVVMACDLALPENQKKTLGWIVAFGLFLIIIISVLFARPTVEPELVWGGLIRFDLYGFVFVMLFMFGAAITSLIAIDSERLGGSGEFYLMLLASTVGMCLMAVSADLIMLYIAIETTSIPMYVAAGFLVEDNKSIESGYKYFLFGAMASAIMLFGFTLIFGFSGTTNLYSIASSFASGGSAIPLIGTLLLVLIGFAFKVSIVPFHFWAPDVYEGAPTLVAGFLSTASKAAGFAVLIRVLYEAYPAYSEFWTAILAVSAVATMTIGNLLALAQRNIKRLLAYSSIAHAGYILIGVLVASELGISSSIFYLVVYLLTNLSAFGAVTIASRSLGSDEISSYAGLSRRNPGMALIFLVSFLSLAGMPPLGGFIAKFLIFAAAVDAGMVWLAVIGLINAIIGLYYYLVVLKVIYLYRSEGDEEPLLIPQTYSLTLGFLTLAIVLIGFIFSPWFNLIVEATSSLF
jgi:NADH-quinone oxidoreductase subunit N